MFHHTAEQALATIKSLEQQSRESSEQLETTLKTTEADLKTVSTELGDIRADHGKALPSLSRTLWPTCDSLRNTPTNGPPFHNITVRTSDETEFENGRSILDATAIFQ